MSFTGSGVYAFGPFVVGVVVSPGSIPGTSFFGPLGLLLGLWQLINSILIWVSCSGCSWPVLALFAVPLFGHVSGRLIV